MQKTTNYQLNQWEATDRLKRADFNADNAQIDATLNSFVSLMETKAEKSAVTAVETALANYKSSNNAAVAAKAETTALTALQNSLNSTNSTVAALSAALGSGGSNARIAWGTYTGTGTYGSSNPNTITVDFYPVLVVVGSAEGAEKTCWPSVYIRDCTAAHSENSTDVPFHVTWAERSVSWYLAKYSAGELQNNKSGSTYYYCVIGC